MEQKLLFVREIKHLGNILQIDNSMTNAYDIKRTKFISKLHSLGKKEFYFADPVTVVKLFSTNACDFYGSQIGDFKSSILKFYNSWNFSIRILFDVPRNTQRYLLEPISRCLQVASRFVAFSED